MERCSYGSYGDTGSAYGLIPPLAATFGIPPIAIAAALSGDLGDWSAQDWIERQRMRMRARRMFRRTQSRTALERLKWRVRLQQQLRGQRQEPVRTARAPIPPRGYPQLGPPAVMRQQQAYARAQQDAMRQGMPAPAEEMAPVAEEAAMVEAMPPEESGIPTWAIVAGAVVIGGGLYYASKGKKGGKSLMQDK